MSLSDDDLRDLLACACDAARAAGHIIAATRPATIEDKRGGHSPASQVLTEVDRAAQACILEILDQPRRRFDHGVLSEEAHDDGSRLQKDFFWSIDPLDGTLPYIEAAPGYAVSVALVARDGTPFIGAVYDPSKDEMYSAARGLGLWLGDERWLAATSKVGDTLSVFVDRSFAAHSIYPSVAAALAELAREMRLEGVEIHSGGGAVMNACNLLRNPPACYFKLPKPEEGGGSLWDFAATACLFAEAGAVATDMRGDRLDLNRRESTFMNHRGALFASSQDLADRLRARFRRLS